jgi:hypothetical protein
MSSQGGVILGRKRAERITPPVALRLLFGALTGPAGRQVAEHAAEIARLTIPPAFDAQPAVLGPSGRPLSEPDGVTRQRVRQQLGAMVRPSGWPLYPPNALRHLEPEPARQEPPPEPTWAALPPGVELAEVVDETDPRALDVDDLVHLVKGCAKLIAHHEAGLAEALAAMTRRSTYAMCTNDSENPHDRIKAVADEVALAMMWTPSHADGRVRAAVELAEQLPATLAALRGGQIDAYKARIIADETAPLRDQPEVRARVEEAALAVAEKKSGPQLRAFVKRQVLSAAPETAEKRRKKARSGRRVERPVAECDGMGSMNVYGPIEDLAALWNAIDAAARARRVAARKTGPDHPEATSSLDELRFDVLTGLGWTGLAAGHLGCCSDDCPGVKQRLGTEQGRPARIGVTVPFSTLMGISDEPGELHGYGPITAEVARVIAADGSWRRLLTDPKSGALLDYGTTRYEPPQNLAEFIIVRDRTCRFPPCNWSAQASQLDHTEPHRQDGTGGATAHYNLGAWHDRHHNAKTSHGWVYSQPEPGRFIMTSPAGLVYEVDEEVIGPIIEEPSPPGDADPPGDPERPAQTTVVDEPDLPAAEPPF